MQFRSFEQNFVNFSLLLGPTTEHPPPSILLGFCADAASKINIGCCQMILVLISTKAERSESLHLHFIVFWRPPWHCWMTCRSRATSNLELISLSCFKMNSNKVRIDNLESNSQHFNAFHHVHLGFLQKPYQIHPNTIYCFRMVK